jgi:hypothetical protein
MAMGKRRRRPTQTSMWVAAQDLPRSAAHPFYTRLNQILDEHDFDEYVEGLCQRFYADDGRPGPDAPPETPAWRAAVGHHPSGAAVGLPTVPAARDSLRSDRPAHSAAGYPASRSERRATSGEPIGRPRRKSISRLGNWPIAQCRPTCGTLRCSTTASGSPCKRYMDG